MKKFAWLCMGVCVAVTFASCKSSESAYKKAYEKAKQQELATQTTPVVVEEVSPVVTPVVSEESAGKIVESAPAEVREEKVTVVSAADGNGLLAYSVVCGSFDIKANADNLKSRLDNDGYKAMVVFNAEKAKYRVIVSTFADKESAAAARDAFKARYPSRKDFQGAWLLYRLD